RNCIRVAIGLSQPNSISHMFESWLQGFGRDLKLLVMLRAAYTCWLIWLCRNDLVFVKRQCYSPLQVVHSVIHWIHTWAMLQKHDNRHKWKKNQQHQWRQPLKDGRQRHHSHQRWVHLV
ncbi:hypothetical protein PVAP13_9KG338300, partial [Panicum virgatum]